MPTCPLFMSAALLALCFSNALHAANVWRVGPDLKLKTPSQAASVARDGDTVEIEAGIYTNDYSHWRQNNLTLRGTGGMAVLVSNQLIPNGKGIWITSGNNVRIENITFTGARVRDTNGAGIRHQGGNLSLNNTYFHRNEFSVLSGKNTSANIEVHNSRFWHQQRSARFSHGIYIGNAGRLVISGSHFTGTDEGHHIKSRALENHIRYNRIEDGDTGNASRLIDLPNCGLSFVFGNEMHKGPRSNNMEIIGYGAEGCDNRSTLQKSLFVYHNTIINDAGAAVLSRNHQGDRMLIANNLFYGRGAFAYGANHALGNVRLKRPATPGQRWHTPMDPRVVDAATPVNSNTALPVPEHVFLPPAGIAPRFTRSPEVTTRWDVGAREYGAER